MVLPLLLLRVPVEDECCCTSRCPVCASAPASGTCPPSAGEEPRGVGSGEGASVLATDPAPLLLLPTCVSPPADSLPPPGAGRVPGSPLSSPPSSPPSADNAGAVPSGKAAGVGACVCSGTGAVTTAGAGAAAALAPPAAAVVCALWMEAPTEQRLRAHNVHSSWLHPAQGQSRHRRSGTRPEMKPAVLLPPRTALGRPWHAQSIRTKQLVLDCRAQEGGVGLDPSSEPYHRQPQCSGVPGTQGTHGQWRST